VTTTRVAEREKTRRRTWWALVISLLVHLTVILAVAWIYFLEIEPPPDPVEEIEITIVEPPTAPPKPTFVDTSAPEAERPPENAQFESDRDTAAASPDAATGAEPLPSQDGREQPFLELENQELALAEVNNAPPAPETPPSEPAPPQPEQTQQTEAEEKKPEPTEADAVLAAAQPEQKKEKQEEPKPPPVPPPSKPSFQRQARPTRLSGSVSNRGRSAVASMATPLGRYRKQITDAIGSSWYHHIGPRMDIFSYGTVSVVFIIDRTGKVRRPRVVSNTSNESFEIVTVESILAADIPPIPPEIVPTLEGGQIEMDYTFSIITN
jgi:outer membrane biosynthesis protein TonB